MNDPHVEALYYRVKHSERVSYENARSLEYENEAFKLRIKKWAVYHLPFPYAPAMMLGAATVPHDRARPAASGSSVLRAMESVGHAEKLFSDLSNRFRPW